MINKYSIKKFCCEDISLIENYDKAISDNTQMWQCHHRLETDKKISAKDLISMDMYYHRPANELIFLTKFEHLSLHHKGKIVSKETRKKQSDSAKKRPPVSEETKQKLSDMRRGEKHWNYGNHFSEESKKKMSESHKNKILSADHKKRISESIKLFWQRRKANNNTETKEEKE